MNIHTYYIVYVYALAIPDKPEHSSEFLIDSDIPQPPLERLEIGSLQPGSRIIFAPRQLGQTALSERADAAPGSEVKTFASLAEGVLEEVELGGNKRSAHNVVQRVG